MAGYNRIATGERIRNRRMIMGLTQEELAEKIGRAYKYCQDIERGTCGMEITRILPNLQTWIQSNRQLSKFWEIAAIRKKDMLWIC